MPETRTEKKYDELEKAMILEMRELLGPGFVPEYYEQLASPFIQIARRMAGSGRTEK